MQGKGRGQANSRERPRQVESNAKVIKIARQKKMPEFQGKSNAKMHCKSNVKIQATSKAKRQSKKQSKNAR